MKRKGSSYKLYLQMIKDELPRTMNRSFDDQPVYAFGYGSLMCPRGISEGRGIQHKYSWKELIPCRIDNYERGMIAYLDTHDINFYGITPREDKWCNGIIFQVHSSYDYYSLMFSEGATWSMMNHKVNTYVPKDVSEHIAGAKNLPKDALVVAVTVEKPVKPRNNRISYNYVDFCERAAKAWGKDFLKDFYATGGWSINEKGV